MSKSLAHTCLVCNNFMSTLFYASLDNHSMFYQDYSCAMSNPCRQSMCIDNDNFLHYNFVCTSISMSFENCRSHARLFSQVPFLVFQLSLSLYFTLTSIVFILYFLWHVLHSLSFTYHKIHSHFSNCHLFCMLAIA